MSPSSISGASAYSNFKSPYSDQIKQPDTPNGELQNTAVQTDPTISNGGPNSSSASNPSNDNDDASEAPKQPPAPLPPGQGTRVDQLV